MRTALARRRRPSPPGSISSRALARSRISPRRSGERLSEAAVSKLAKTSSRRWPRHDVDARVRPMPDASHAPAMADLFPVAHLPAIRRDVGSTRGGLNETRACRLRRRSCPRGSLRTRPQRGRAGRHRRHERARQPAWTGLRRERRPLRRRGGAGRVWDGSPLLLHRWGRGPSLLRSDGRDQPPLAWPAATGGRDSLPRHAGSMGATRSGRTTSR